MGSTRRLINRLRAPTRRFATGGLEGDEDKIAQHFAKRCSTMDGGVLAAWYLQVGFHRPLSPDLVYCVVYGQERRRQPRPDSITRCRIGSTCHAARAPQEAGTKNIKLSASELSTGEGGLRYIDATLRIDSRKLLRGLKGIDYGNLVYAVQLGAPKSTCLNLPAVWAPRVVAVLLVQSTYRSTILVHFGQTTAGY